jgi:hypothetical protein
MNSLPPDHDALRMPAMLRELRALVAQLTILETRAVANSALPLLPHSYLPKKAQKLNFPPPTTTTDYRQVAETWRGTEQAVETKLAKRRGSSIDQMAQPPPPPMPRPTDGQMCAPTEARMPPPTPPSCPLTRCC